MSQRSAKIQRHFAGGFIHLAPVCGRNQSTESAGAVLTLQGISILAPAIPRSAMLSTALGPLQHLRMQTENKFDGDPHSPNDGFATKNLGVRCYTSKKCLVDHGCFWFYVLANILFAEDIVDSKRLEGHAIEV